MARILCAIRGGEEGHRTQDAAAALARDRGDELVFLVVLETSFLKAPEKGGIDLRATLTRMGNSILSNAAERARALGVEARGVLREGNPREQIIEAARAEGATVVVLGRPRGCYDKFSLAGLKAFAAEIEGSTGAEVEIL